MILKQLLPQKDFTLSNFAIGKKLGSGKFSDVYYAIDKYTGFSVALKAIKKETIIENKLEPDIINEIRTQKRLNHPNIINLYGYFYENNILYLIQEYGSGTDLYSDLKKQTFKKYSETKVAEYLIQVILALLYIHSKGILHRDLKPENILLCSGIIKICDFGYAAYVQKDQMRQTFCGTLDYVSPEMLSKKGYSFSVDYWSVGILAYELLFGNSPFKSENQEITFDKVIKNELQFDGPISFDGADFLKKMLIKNPQQRMNLENAYQHPFIQKALKIKENVVLNQQELQIIKKD